MTVAFQSWSTPCAVTDNAVNPSSGLSLLAPRRQVPFQPRRYQITLLTGTDVVSRNSLKMHLLNNNANQIVTFKIKTRTLTLNTKTRDQDSENTVLKQNSIWRLHITLITDDIKFITAETTRSMKLSQHLAPHQSWCHMSVSPTAAMLPSINILLNSAEQT